MFIRWSLSGYRLGKPTALTIVAAVTVLISGLIATTAALAGEYAALMGSLSAFSVQIWSWLERTSPGPGADVLARFGGASIALQPNGKSLAKRLPGS